ncbi:carboxy terminal-processing peptidase [Escherichia coli]
MRVSRKDPEFQNIMKDIARFNAMKDKRNIVSLNYAVREQENNEDDATRLARLNERFKREGKPELKKLDDLTERLPGSRILIWMRR